MKHRYECKQTGDYDVRVGCSECQKDEEADASMCSHCGRTVSNGAFFRTTSPHFKGTCKPDTFYPEKIPAPNWSKKLPYPMPRMPDYFASNAAYYTYIGKRNGKEFMAAHGSGTGIQTYADLAKWWGVPMIGDAPDGDWRDARWITALFAGQCAKCSSKIEANQKAFYNKSTRKLLCESAECGKRAARERWAA